MELQAEQKQTVAQWVAAGDNLSTIQKKLADQFKVSLTYMEVRFLVDDLNLELHDPKPAPDASLRPSKDPEDKDPQRSEKKGFLDKMKEKVGLGGSKEEVVEAPPEEETEDYEDELLADEDSLPAGGGVQIAVDQVTLIPGAVASGSVTFSDGVTGKWIIDQYGRPGFTEISKTGYRPSQADAQSFMQELGRALQSRGF